jgi:hypothetical protein
LKRYLLIALGFTSSNLEALRSRIAQKGYSDRVRVIGRPFPAKARVEQNSFDASDYSFLVDAGYRSLFEEMGKTLFCNHEHKVCALQFGKSKKSCLNSDPSRCRDSRPDVIVLAYMASPNFRIGGRLGRFSLPLKCPADLFGRSQQLASYCIDQIDEIEKQKYWTSFNSKDSRKVLLLPIRNFQNGGRTVALNSINSVEDFDNFLEMAEDLIVKKGVKIIDERGMEFKEDFPHRYPRSTVEKIHILNAHYRHGFWFDCRHHYDVTEKDDGDVKKARMYNVETNDICEYSGDHLNIFANDDVQ